MILSLKDLSIQIKRGSFELFLYTPYGTKVPLAILHFDVCLGFFCFFLIISSLLTYIFFPLFPSAKCFSKSFYVPIGIN